MTRRGQRRSWLSPLFLAGLFLLGPRRAAADPDTAERLVTLPPYIVEDQGKPLPWRYAEVGHFQILSLSPPGTTEHFAQQLYSLEEQLAWLLPEQFRFRTSVPATYILCDSTMIEKLNEDIPAEAFLERASPAAAATAMPRRRFETEPQLGLEDQDAYITFSLLDPTFLNEGQIAFRPETMEMMLVRRTPPLPAWFIGGFDYLYGGLSFAAPVTTIVSAGAGGGVPGSGVTVLTSYGGWRSAGVYSPAFIRISPRADKQLAAQIGDALKRRMPTAGLLPSLRDLLTKPNPPPPADPGRRAWLAQAALFVRWALDPENGTPLATQPAWRDRFWTFLARTSSEPVTEEMFRGCFGLSWAEADDALARYFVRAISRNANLGTPPSRPPRLPSTEATPDDVARIKGDWERLEIGFVKKTYVALDEAYRAHARETLWSAYDHGDRDPRLLAIMGLFACDEGDDTAAQPWLSAAVQARVVRPRAYFELARILYAKAVARPLGAAGKLSVAQTRPILTLLTQIRDESPPLLPASELFANVWFHSELFPSRADLDALGMQAMLFPRSLDLTFQAALLEAQAGNLPEANALIDRGLRQPADGRRTDRLLRLKALLATARGAR